MSRSDNPLQNSIYSEEHWIDAVAESAEASLPFLEATRFLELAPCQVAWWAGAFVPCTKGCGLGPWLRYTQEASN